MIVTSVVVLCCAQVSYQELDRVQTDIRSSVRSGIASAVSSLNDQLARVSKCRPDDILADVTTWLTRGYLPSSLVTTMAQSFHEAQLASPRRLQAALVRLGVRTHPAALGATSTLACPLAGSPWVPAVFGGQAGTLPAHGGAPYRVYGGVNLPLNMDQRDGRGDSGNGSGDGSGSGSGSGGGGSSGYQNWSLGSGKPIHCMTRAMRAPVWSTVRKRYWKERAYAIDKKGIGSDSVMWNTDIVRDRDGTVLVDNLASNLERMRRGYAPKDHWGHSIELHHDIPQSSGRCDVHVPWNIREVTREQHAAMDSFRRLAAQVY